jgi:hypothetical protein
VAEARKDIRSSAFLFGPSASKTMKMDIARRFKEGSFYTEGDRNSPKAHAQWFRPFSDASTQRRTSRTPRELSGLVVIVKNRRCGETTRGGEIYMTFEKSMDLML